MMILNIFILYITFISSAFSQTPVIFINEFLASNETINEDKDFEQNSDWLELYNPHNETIDLSNWYLTDNLDIPDKWQIPNGISISPGEFFLFWADGQDTIINSLHTNFKLSAEGEAIGLFDSNQNLIDSIIYSNQQVDISMGRNPDGEINWSLFDNPTPGSSNNTSIYLKLEPPNFSIEAGFYSEPQSLIITTNEPDATIRFTTDGNDPTEQSLIYTNAIEIKSRIGEANIFSEIRTNQDPFDWLPDWESPNGEVFKSSVIRAKVFKDGYNPSETITKTYFIDENIFQKYETLPVISLVSDYKNLFDENTGIYVPGIYHQPGNSGSGNYFQDWEKPAHIEYFDLNRDLGFSQDVGINVQGGTSPASPQKGLHVIARSEYGSNRINYPLFENDPSKANKLDVFKRFILRSWGSLISGSLFNDAYAHRLMAKHDLDIQAYQPVVVFINGEYWGLHSLRESNKNSWYYQSHYDINRDEPGYDILNHSSRNNLPYAYADEGDANNWNLLMTYMNTHDMTLSDNYEYLKSKIDIKNFISYIGHCVYLGKWDWPNNNDGSWRPRTVDAKWRWIQFDMETSFGVATSLGPQFAGLGPQLNMIKAVTVGEFIPGFGVYGPHPIVAKIYKNQEFQDSLKSWFTYKMQHEFHPDSMNYLLDQMAEEIRPYIPEYKDRCPYIGDMFETWENSLLKIKEFNNLRPQYMLQHLDNLTNIENSTVFNNFELYQNYPNPFNPVTTIKYSVPAKSVMLNSFQHLNNSEIPKQVRDDNLNVSLKIYDILGREIRTLVNKQHKPGNYQVEWNASNFPSGIYFYKLTAGNFIDIKKMILLK
ncbi:MAG: CotH kinase family protein [Ignavibacteriales bacterium]|nr:CotH kinase family protein [Ignavibacteriales bacterium]